MQAMGDTIISKAMKQSSVICSNQHRNQNAIMNACGSNAIMSKI